MSPLFQTMLLFDFKYLPGTIRFSINIKLPIPVIYFCFRSICNCKNYSKKKFQAYIRTYSFLTLKKLPHTFNQVFPLNSNN
jgi:hypothetical protein